VKRLRDMLIRLAKPVANARIPFGESTKDELQVEIRHRRRLARRTVKLSMILDDYRKQDGALYR